MAPTMTKKEANYRIPSGTNREPCRICDMFHKDGRCDLVRGSISAAGTCEHFVNEEK